MGGQSTVIRSNADSIPLYITLGGGADGGTDIAAWQADFQADRAPDRCEYGLDGLAELGFSPWFRPPPKDGPLRSRLRPFLVHRSGGIDLATLTEEARRRRRYKLAFAWDEGTALPLALGRSMGEPVCVSGLIWWTDYEPSNYRLYNSAASRAIANLGGIFVLCEAQLGVLVEQYHRDLADTWFIPYGISVDQWSKEVAVPQEPGLIVSAGNDRDRDWSLLERALRRQTGTERLRVELHTRSNITLARDLGEVRRDSPLSTLREAYNRSAFVIVPTKHNLHASGVTVALEAACAGRAVIACRTPGMEEYIIDGVTGFLVAPGDDAALADRARLLHHDPQLAAALGERAHDRVMERNRSSDMVARIADLLHLVYKRDCLP
jgi:glycosyltransferase involved in cell wall biosynthesis